MVSASGNTSIFPVTAFGRNTKNKGLDLIRRTRGRQCNEWAPGGAPLGETLPLGMLPQTRGESSCRKGAFGGFGQAPLLVVHVKLTGHDWDGGMDHPGEGQEAKSPDARGHDHFRP